MTLKLKKKFNFQRIKFKVFIHLKWQAHAKKSGIMLITTSNSLNIKAKKSIQRMWTAQNRINVFNTWLALIITINFYIAKKKFTSITFLFHLECNWVYPPLPLKMYQTMLCIPLDLHKLHACIANALQAALM